MTSVIPGASNTTDPFTKIKPEEVEYLVLEGGGGKGVAYLGAIKALEALKILPIKIAKNVPQKLADNSVKIGHTRAQGASKILGISGSSAGAITAFCLAIGMRSKQLLEVLRWKGASGKYSIFDDFFNSNCPPPNSTIEMRNDKRRQPLMAKVRRSVNVTAGGVVSVGLRDVQAKPDLSPMIEGTGPSMWLSMGIDSKVVPAVVKAARSGSTLADAMLDWARRQTPMGRDRSLGQDPNGKLLLSAYWPIRRHLRCLTTMGGLFPGLEVRGFFRRILREYLFTDKTIQERIKTYNEHFCSQARIGKNIAKRIFVPGETWPPGPITVKTLGVGEEQLTFSQLRYLTGVDLVVTGTNITFKRPMEFSADRTPDFPVIEALMISMNLPGVFTPVEIACDVFRDEVEFKAFNVTTFDPTRSQPRAMTMAEYNAMYRGTYVDGGMLNNLPLHAFDLPAAAPFEKYGDPQYPLRTRQANPAVLALRLTDGFRGQEDFSTADLTVQDGAFGTDFLMRTLDLAVFRQAETAQVDSPTYLARLVHCYTHLLSTEQFYAPRAVREMPIVYSFFAVLDYFGETVGDGWILAIHRQYGPATVLGRMPTNEEMEDYFERIRKHPPMTRRQFVERMIHEPRRMELSGALGTLNAMLDSWPD